MAKIKYNSDGLFGTTPCPFNATAGFGIAKVNSHYCTHNCKFYRETNHKEKIVICLADCSSQLEEILNKIDLVIANDRFDDICFEDFLAEVRESIAKVLDGTKMPQERRIENGK